MMNTPTSKSLFKNGISLYIHIPFCQTKCSYCDFNTYQGLEHLISPFLDALVTELHLWGHSLNHPTINTIFFGGGTPSYLPQGALERILKEVSQVFDIKKDAEITAEANPDDLDEQTCASMLAQGINRLSIGVQSLNNAALQLLGRRHNSEKAIHAYSTAQKSGFNNINLDLMYGLPNQSISHWHHTTQVISELQPSHISMYCLTLEQGTPLFTWVEQKKLSAPDSDLAADMYHYAEELLEEQGYVHYEISNWSKPGLPSEHNLAYWTGHPYLGVGPGAHSYLDRYRFWNVDSPKLYISQVKNWEDSQPQKLTILDNQAFNNIKQIGGSEYIDCNLYAAESMFLGLRILEGIDLASVSADTTLDLKERYKNEINDLQNQGLLEWSDSKLRLTKSAYLIANQVFTEFLV